MHRTARTSLCILGLLPPCLPQAPVPPAGTRPLDDALQPVRTRLAESVQDGSHPSIAVAVARAGRILWEEALGCADLATKARATPATAYPIASLTKSMTAVGVMVLVERGAVDLDAPVARYLGEGGLRVFAGSPEAVTVRAVMQMRAGIPHGWQVGPHDRPGQDIHALVRERCMVVFPAGETWTYSNFAYGVLEAVIERVSGRSYAEFMEEAVFTPLRMAQANVGYRPAEGYHVATKYGTGRQPIPHVDFRPAGSAGVYASVHDLLLYGAWVAGTPIAGTPVSGTQAAGQEQILAETSRARMLRTEGATEALPGGLGFGCVALGDGLTWVLSNGGIGGATSMLTVVPERKLVIAVLTNTQRSPSSADAVALEIADALIPGFRDRVTRAIARRQARARLSGYAPGEPLLGVWKGEIRGSGAPLQVSLSVGPKDANLTLGSAEPVALRAPRADAARFQGSLRARVPTGVATEPAPQVVLELRRVGPTLIGHASATFRADGTSYRVPCFVTLRRD